MLSSSLHEPARSSPDFRRRDFGSPPSHSAHRVAARDGDFPGDDDEHSRHFGAFLDGQLVGVATIHFVPLLDQPDFDPAYQLRGMATAEAQRGLGVGRALLAACIEAAKQGGGQWIWCNARTPAAGFYAQNGFKIRGNMFEIPTAGPHVRMLRAL